MKNINELTEDCLIWLFSQFSLQELIELRKVCQLWTIIIEQICNRKKSLMLFKNIKILSTYSENLLNFKHQTDALMLLKTIGKDDDLIGCCWNEVSNLFLNVQNLIYYDLPEELDEVLKAMPNITTLTLSGFNEEISYFSQHEYEKRSKSLESLNKLTSLKHFHLDGNFLVPIGMGRNENKFPDVAILSQLESFSLINYKEDIIPIINQLGGSMRKLTLNVIFDFDKLNQMFKPEIYTKLTYLSIETHYTENAEYRKLFHFICENFPSLETFEFYSISSFTQDEAIFSLAKLKNLAHLSVNGMWNVENILLTEKLGQIRTLQLTFDVFGKKTFPLVDIQSIFTNLESITILSSNNEFLNSAKSYLVDEQKLTCKVNCDLLNTSSLTYMGRHRDKYETDREQRRIKEEEDYRREWWEKYGDDYQDDDRYSQQSSSQESFYDPSDYYNYSDCDYGYD